MPDTYPKDFVEDWPLGGLRPAQARRDPVRAQAALIQASVARQLANYRTLDARYTQQRLVRLSGLSRSTISRLEAGSTWGDWQTIVRLCAALGLRVQLVPADGDEDVLRVVQA